MTKSIKELLGKVGDWIIPIIISGIISGFIWIKDLEAQVKLDKANVEANKELVILKLNTISENVDTLAKDQREIKRDTVIIKGKIASLVTLSNGKVSYNIETETPDIK